MARALILALALVALALPGRAAAHLSPTTLASLDVRERDVALELLIPEGEIVRALGGRPDDRAIARHLAARTAAATPDGRPWRIALGPVERIDDGTGPDVRVRMTLIPPAGASPRAFRLRYGAVIERVPNHLAMVFVRQDYRAGRLGDDPMLIGALRGAGASLPIDLGAGAARRGFAAAMRLGMHHIAEGRDHLLFLVTLMLAAPLVASRGRWRLAGGTRHTLFSLAAIVTAFTAGHSLTLVAGALLGQRLPTMPVEVAIALSILVSAAHAIRPVFAGREALVAGGFGLVHGLAFATIIGGLVIDPWHRAQAILGFNLGIELIQLAIVAACLPALLLLAPRPIYRPLRVIGAAGAGAAALLWIADRAFGLLADEAARLDEALGQAPWLLAALTLLGAALAWRDRATASPRQPPDVSRMPPPGAT